MVPPQLTSSDALERLCELLLEKESLLGQVKARGFGSRVTKPEEAYRLLAKVIQITREALNLDTLPPSSPQLVLTRRLSLLRRHVIILYLLLLIPILVFFPIAVYHSKEGAAFLFTCFTVLSIFVIPLLVYRRTRMNIEHDCMFIKNKDGNTLIIIDQLPSVQFQSYLAHEFAHYLYDQWNEKRGEKWEREGWSRMVQWKVMKYLYKKEGNPAYLYHVLIQIVWELKFACQMISMTLHQQLPTRISRISTIYGRNPLWRWVTGTPGFNITGLTDHAIGTASYFLIEKRHSLHQALRGMPFTEKRS